MDKPISLSVKQFLIRRMAVEMIVPEKTIEAVVNHQFSSMLDVMSHSYSVELSGFGKFLFNNNKALRMLQKHHINMEINKKLLSQDITAQKRRNVLMRIASLEEAIETLTPRVHDKI